MLVGSGISLFSKSRKAWKSLVAEEKDLKDKISRSGGNSALRSKLAKVTEDKNKAKKKYNRAKEDTKDASMIAGGALGAVAGGIAGYNK